MTSGLGINDRFLKFGEIVPACCVILACISFFAY